MEATLRKPAKPIQYKSAKNDRKTPLREGFSAEERKELQYAVSITDYIREKGITI